MKREIKSDNNDLEVLRKGKPYLRSIVALLVWLRLGEDGKENVKRSYVYADTFLAQLEQDVRESI